MAATQLDAQHTPRQRKRDIFKSLIRAGSKAGHKRTSSLEYYERLDDDVVPSPEQSKAVALQTVPLSVENLNKAAAVVSEEALKQAAVRYTRYSSTTDGQADAETAADTDQHGPTEAVPVLETITTAVDVEGQMRENERPASHPGAQEGPNADSFFAQAAQEDVPFPEDPSPSNAVNLERRSSLNQLRGLRISHSRKLTLDLENEGAVVNRPGLPGLPASAPQPAGRVLGPRNPRAPDAAAATLAAAAAKLEGLALLQKETVDTEVQLKGPPGAAAVPVAQLSPALLQAMVVRQQRLLGEKDGQIAELQSYVGDLREKLSSLLQETYYWQKQLEATKVKEAAAVARAAQLERAQQDAQSTLDSNAAEQRAAPVAVPAPITAEQAEEMAEEFAAEAIAAIQQDADLVLKEVAVMVGCAYWKQRYNEVVHDGRTDTRTAAEQDAHQKASPQAAVAEAVGDAVEDTNPATCRQHSVPNGAAITSNAHFSSDDVLAEPVDQATVDQKPAQGEAPDDGDDDEDDAGSVIVHDD